MSTDHDYYMIGLRTNMAGESFVIYLLIIPSYFLCICLTLIMPLLVLGTHVDGLFGSAGGESMGMVWYPFKWVLPPGTYGDTDYANPIEIDVGPWDCDVGAPLTVDECCSLIKSSVPFADVNGNFLECYANYPVGSVQNPEVSSRVIILTNHQGIVVKAPVAE